MRGIAVVAAVSAAKSPFRLAAIISGTGEIGTVFELANVKC